MPLFKYRAVDGDGKAVEGTQEAQSARSCVAELTERGLRVNAVERAEGQRRGRFKRKGALTWEDLDLFNEQLLTLAKSGLPLASSLEALAGDVRRKRLRSAIQDIRARLEAGASLAEALDDRPESFPAFYRGIVRAGERSGNLSGVLSHLCTHSARMIELKHGLQEAMAYPAIVLLAVCGVLTFLLLSVVPEFMAFYAAFEGELPAPTRFLAFLSNLLRYHGPSVLTWGGVGAVAVVFVGCLLWRNAARSYAVDWLMLKLPVFGSRNYDAAVARFSRSLGMLLASEVPVVESVKLAAEAADNVPLRNAAHAASRRIENGETIADALKGTGFFTTTYCWMLGNAERAGEIDAALLDLADDREQDVERRDRLIVSMSGPVLVLLLGLLVGLMVFSLYLPIYSVGEWVTG